MELKDTIIKIALLLSLTLPFDGANASNIIAQDFKVYPWGYTFVWENHPGSNMGSQVLFVKFERLVKALDSRTVEVLVKYPEVPENLLRTHTVVQYGTAFSCDVNRAYIDNVKVTSRKAYKISFAHPNQKRANDPVAALEGELPQDANVCKLTIQFDQELTSAQVNQINWNLAVTSGFENLNIIERTFVEKSFSTVAAPYIAFLNDSDVNFRTDDELWFLAAASIHREPTLAQSFKKSSRNFVSNWVRKLASYVVRNVEDEKYEELLKKYLGSNLKNENTYKIEVDTQERLYEI